MQKITLILSFLCLSTFAFAQKNESSLIKARVKDGSIMVGGNLSGSYQKYESGSKFGSGRIITLDFLTKSGYFFLPDLAVGANIGINHRSDSRDTVEQRLRRTYVLAGPFVRYYWDMGIFAEVNANIGLEAISGNPRTSVFSTAGGLGYAFFLTDNVTIEPMLTFNYYQFSRPTQGDTKVKDTQFGPVLSIGLQAYLYSPTRILPTR